MRFRVTEFTICSSCFSPASLILISFGLRVTAIVQVLIELPLDCWRARFINQLLAAQNSISTARQGEFTLRLRLEVRHTDQHVPGNLLGNLPRLCSCRRVLQFQTPILPIFGLCSQQRAPILKLDL